MSSSIRTVFWDIGGVILTNGWAREQRNPVLERLGIDIAAYEVLNDPADYYWERGLMTAEEFFLETVLRPNPKLGITFDVLWPQVCARSKVLHPECLDILADMRQSGKYRLATLNNESPELNAHRLDAFKLRPLFDYFVCSGYVHEMKPNPGIYKLAIELSGYPASTALLIDDQRPNCEAARAMGMNAILFENPAQLSAALTEMGIAVPEPALG